MLHDFACQLHVTTPIIIEESQKTVSEPYANYRRIICVAPSLRFFPYLSSARWTLHIHQESVDKKSPPLVWKESQSPSFICLLFLMVDKHAKTICYKKSFTDFFSTKSRKAFFMYNNYSIMLEYQINFSFWNVTKNLYFTFIVFQMNMFYII